jgi:hypothetical protein
MRHTKKRALWSITGLLFASIGLAEEYDYELGIAFNSSDFEGSQTTTTNLGTVFSSTEVEADDLSLSGSWYFKGLSDEKGPRARATLVDRASSLTVGYSRADQTISTTLTSSDPAFPFPPLDSKFDADTDTFAVNFRYVDRDSGWIGNAGLLTTKTSIGGPANSSADATGWRLGVGKYLLENTTLGLDVSQVNVDGGSDATVIAVAFEHLGDVGEQWQYAVDIGFSRADADGSSDVDIWRAALSLYPTRDFEFGVAVEDLSGGIAGQDNLGFEGFASWFVSPNVRLSARYRVDDVDYLGGVSIGGTSTSSADQDSFGIGASVRF